MSRNSNEINQFKNQVMKKYGYQGNEEDPNQVKYEVANELGIPLRKGYNGDMEAKNAGKIGGNIGGKMVREMIKMAENSLSKK